MFLLTGLIVVGVGLCREVGVLQELLLQQGMAHGRQVGGRRGPDGGDGVGRRLPLGRLPARHMLRPAGREGGWNSFTCGHNKTSALRRGTAARWGMNIRQGDSFIVFEDEFRLILLLFKGKAQENVEIKDVSRFHPWVLQYFRQEVPQRSNFTAVRSPHMYKKRNHKQCLERNYLKCLFFNIHAYFSLYQCSLYSS